MPDSAADLLDRDQNRDDPESRQFDQTGRILQRLAQCFGWPILTTRGRGPGATPDEIDRH